MKLLSAKFEVILLILWALSILNATNAAGENWKLYYVSDNDLYFYDVDSITKFKEVAKVSEKSVSRQIKQYNLIEALREIVKIEKKSGSEMSDELHKKVIDDMAVQETKSLCEMRCSQRMYRIITGMEYDKEGTLIDAVISSKWDRVKPDSIFEKLYDAICRETE
jgi:hypothetical protein